MKEVRDCWCIQIDVTNRCERKCSNCTHLVKYAKPWTMDLTMFKKAVDSLEGFDKVVGIIGGNPMLHPDIFEMIGYLQFKVKKDNRGIWISTFGKAVQTENVIKEIFPQHHIYFNDHNKPNWHQPVLVASKDLILDEEERKRYISDCWLANNWSPSINTKGVYRCEVMAAMDMALNLNLGLPLEKDWWKRPLSDFQHQIDTFCHRCGECVPMERRLDSEQIDDVSESNKELTSLVPERARIYDASKYDARNITNWFPCEYRKENKKPIGITVSVGYGDCLDKILPFNIKHLDKIYVVTTTTDTKTKEVCAKYPQVEVIETDLFFRHGAKFNKGAAVELATWLLPKDQWCVIFDSDICFPADCFLLDQLDRNCMYWCQRGMVFDDGQFQKATKSRNFNFDGLEIVNLGPIGAFQLFNTSASALNFRPWYGINIANAGHCDNIFQWKWHPNNLRELPMKTLHLGDRHNWECEVEGTFPRPNTPVEKVTLSAIMNVEVETMLIEIWDELKRLGRLPVAPK